MFMADANNATGCQGVCTHIDVAHYRVSTCPRPVSTTLKINPEHSYAMRIQYVLYTVTYLFDVHFRSAWSPLRGAVVLMQFVYF